MQFETWVVRLRESIRLDRYLTGQLPHVSRNRIQRHIEHGDVLVDGRRVRPSHRLHGGETLRLPPLAERRLAAVAEEVEFRVVYEDADLMVVDKPAGLVMHPVGRESRRTLLGGLHRRLESRGEPAAELGIVHRLDRLTSGLVVVAKNLEARRRLAHQGERRGLRRIYLGFVHGPPPAASGCIDLFIRRDPRRPTRMQTLDAAAATAANLLAQPPVSASGYSDPRRDLRARPARTHYRILRRFPNATLLQLELDTGRTHQIRVHLQAIGAPLLGDPIYGAPGTDRTRPALHAARLEFDHPTSGAKLRFAAPMPVDLHALVRRLAAGH